MNETDEDDLSTHQRIALKVLSLRQMTTWNMLDLFEREAKRWRSQVYYIGQHCDALRSGMAGRRQFPVLEGY